MPRRPIVDIGHGRNKACGRPGRYPDGAEVVQLGHEKYRAAEPQYRGSGLPTSGVFQRLGREFTEAITVGLC
jgi:hypothetical protein